MKSAYESFWRALNNVTYHHCLGFGLDLEINVTRAPGHWVLCHSASLLSLDFVLLRGTHTLSPATNN